MKKDFIDNDLGKLSFSDHGEVKDFSTKLTLSISNQKVDIFFRTASKQNLPTQNQKQFLKSIIANFDNLVSALIAVLPDELKTCKNIHEVKNNFDLIALTIPEVDKGERDWDMTFQNKQNKDTFLIAYVEQLSVVSSHITKDEKKRFTKFLLRLLNGKS